MEFLNIIRFSNTGFEPQLQTYQLKKLKYIALGKWKKEYGKEESIYRNLADSQKNLNYKFAYGVYAFIECEPDPFYLNHLPKNKIRHLKCWVAEIPLDCEVYNPFTVFKPNEIIDGVIDKRNIIVAEKGQTEIFIPKSSLHLLQNIKEIENPFKKKEAAG